jgi:RimJ/RimL family protein N-acetyltransferase
MVSLLIGEVKYWKNGIATKSINLVRKIAKNELGLYKLYAGCYKENIPSQKAFLKNKYKKEGVQKNQIIVGNKRSDLIWYGLVLKK